VAARVKENAPVGLPAPVVDDPDGNQLFFNYPNETASGQTLRDEA